MPGALHMGANKSTENKQFDTQIAKPIQIEFNSIDMAHLENATGFVFLNWASTLQVEIIKVSHIKLTPRR